MARAAKGPTAEIAKATADEASRQFSLQKRGLTYESMRVLRETIWPGASERGCYLAVDYCRARNLDPFKKPVHIVPIWSKDANNGQGGYVESIWPGIAEIETTASRTREFAGKDATEFGDTVAATFGKEGDTTGTGQKKKKLEPITMDFPEWAQVTVYRIIQGQRCRFVGPKCFWLEYYSTLSRWVEHPNEMWRKRAFAQLEKCALAGALRLAFPEELGGVYAAEEMEGKVAAAHVNAPEFEGDFVVVEDDEDDEDDELPAGSGAPAAADSAEGSNPPKVSDEPPASPAPETDSGAVSGQGEGGGGDLPPEDLDI